MELIMKNTKVIWEVWRGDRESAGYRLLTEAEWEYACRSKSTKQFCFGDRADRLLEYGVYIRNPEPGGARPIRSKMPNAWGLFDMHGNVAEWCEDWFGEYSVDNKIDPRGPQVGNTRVNRGGGWFSQQAEACGSAYRSNRRPDDDRYPIGIRVGLGSERRPD